MLALREVQDVATIIALAEALQRHGEYRQSSLTARRLVLAGEFDLRVWKAAYPRAYPQLVESVATEYELDPRLLWAFMLQESAFYPRAVSVSNAQGLMQFMPVTWNWIAELLEEEPANPFDVAHNIRYGAYHLRFLFNLEPLNKDIELIIPSWNGGQGYIQRLFEGDVVKQNKDDFYRMIDRVESREYLQSVFQHYRIYQALY